MRRSDHAVESLLRFCDFLVLRLHTENLELLRRGITEFYATPRRFTTVDALVAVAFPAVTILPVNNPDASAVDRALVLLLRVRHRRVAPMHRRALRNLHDGLCDQIQLVNWHWLLCMYDEFSNGVQTTLVEFVARSAMAIAVFPIAPVKSPPLLIKQDDGASKTVSRTTASGPSINTSKEDALAHAVRCAQQRIVRSAPWEQLFDVADIRYPFDPSAHPALAEGLRSFWEQHARAVWERNFWPPLSETSDVAGSPYYVRKQRQADATYHFVRKVIVPIFSTFGARFFVDLDAHGQELHWWWYRRPIVELLKMATAVGEDECIRYTTTQAQARVPILPHGFQVCSRGYQVTPVSMWATMQRVHHVAEAIKQFVNGRARQTKKRRRKAKRRQ